MKASLTAGSLLAGLLALGGAARMPAGKLPAWDYVFTQTPRGQLSGEGGRIVRLSAAGPRVLTGGFHSAADPEVSFDATKILFAAKRIASDPWNIYEMNADGSGARQITLSVTDCRSPIYQPSIFYLDDAAPAAQIAFASVPPGETARALYSIRLDGSGQRRLTYNPAGAFGPAMLPDGRMVFTSGRPGRMALFGINIDGTDYAAFAGDQGGRMQTMPAVTAERQVVFVEPAATARDGAGPLSLIDLRRNLHSYRRLTLPAAGVFYSPSPLPGGAVVTARRPATGGTFAIYRFDPATRRLLQIFDDPSTDEIQPKALAPREVPDGRSSVVDENVNWAKLYCLNVYDSDLPPQRWPRGSVKRIRIVEWVPTSGSTRLIGEAPVDEDGSFHAQIPANIPVRIQALDANGIALRASAWFWAKNKEQRGCIGCHEDGERTPENIMAGALARPAANLVLPAERRRSVDYSRDIAPILAAKCANTACHTADALAAPRYVVPGEARNSPLVRALFRKAAPMPPRGSPPLTDAERRAIVEWIDMGGVK